MSRKWKERWKWTEGASGGGGGDGDGETDFAPSAVDRENFKGRSNI